MTRLWRAILLSLCVTSLTFGFRTFAAAEPGKVGIERQILVMVKLAPPHLRPNYESGTGYGDDPGRSARARHAKRIARKLGLSVVANWPMPLIALDCFVMEVPDGRSVEDLAERASLEPGIAWAQPVRTFRTRASTPSYNDPLIMTQPALWQWNLQRLHEMATGRGVVVAIIDSGIDALHPDLRGQIGVVRNFAEGAASIAEQHGTAVAGIVAAKGNNGVGIVGVAPRARLMALRACQQADPSQSAICDSLSLAKALHFAIENKAKVINLSLSGPHDPLLAKLLRLGFVRGAAIVAPYDPGIPKGGFPASLPGVIAVSDEALPVPSARVYFAPGRDVPTTLVGGRWYLVNGNSYAAAHVTGLIALLRDRQPRAGASDLAKGRGGTIDACRTLVRVSMPCECTCASAVVTPQVARQQSDNSKR